MVFTDGSLATFMANELAGTGEALFGATPATHASIVQAVAWVASLLGPIADQTDDLKTMTVATWRAWVAARAQSVKDVDLKAGSAELKLAQRFDHIAKSALLDAETAALRYSEVAAALAGGSTAYVSEVSTAGSPYAWPQCAEF